MGDWGIGRGGRRRRGRKEDASDKILSGTGTWLKHSTICYCYKNKTIFLEELLFLELFCRWENVLKYAGTNIILFFYKNKIINIIVIIILLLLLLFLKKWLNGLSQISGDRLLNSSNVVVFLQHLWLTLVQA